MGDKPFKTYDELVKKLRDDKKLTIAPEDEARVIKLLKKYSYFSLVSGYKNLFKAADGTYCTNTTIDDIFALYQFDDTLRDIFFHAIQIIEKHIKSLLSYAFVNKYGEEQAKYLSPLNYDALPNTQHYDKRQKEIKALIKMLFSAVTPPADHNYISHQWKKYNNVPLWAAVKTMTFGNISKMYSLCTQDIKSEVAKEFKGVYGGALEGMLDMLTRVRNVCAHNERLYDFSVSKSRAIQDMPIHKALGISKTSGVYNQGKNDLFAALICLKYLLEESDFRETVADIENALDNLKKHTKQIERSKILSEMGFPQNWKDIL